MAEPNRRTIGTPTLTFEIAIVCARVESCPEAGALLPAKVIRHGAAGSDGRENGAGITCSIENDGTAENPTENRSVNCRAIQSALSLACRSNGCVRIRTRWRLRSEDRIGEIGVLCMIHTEPAHREHANVVRTRNCPNDDIRMRIPASGTDRSADHLSATNSVT